MSIQTGILKLATVVVVALGLIGCDTVPGGLNGMGKDPMTRETVVCSDGACSADQYVVAAIATTVVNEQLMLQYSGKFESAATGCVVYGVPYAAAGATQGLFYAGALTGPAAGLSGVTGCMGGAANGLYTYSYAVDAGTGTHTETVLRDWENGTKIPKALRQFIPNIEELCAGMHVSPSYVRTYNRTPDNMPDWHGPKAGTPVQH